MTIQWTNNFLETAIRQHFIANFGKRLDFEIEWQKERNSKRKIEQETGVRYCLYNALVSNKWSSSTIKLEFPYGYKNQKLDTAIFIDGKPIAIFEIKFNWGRIGGTTRRTGLIFADFFRLLNFQQEKKIGRYFIHVSNKAMLEYLRNQKEYKFPLEQNSNLFIDRDYFRGKSDTFIWNALAGTPKFRNKSLPSEKMENDRKNFYEKIRKELHENPDNDLDNQINCQIKCILSHDVREKEPKCLIFVYEIVPV